MRALIVLLALGACLVMGGCSTVEVQSDYDPAADFASLKTYAWYAEEQPTTGDIRVDNPIVDSRIRTAVETQLNAKGYTKVDANPDFFLIYHAAVSKEIAVTTTTSTTVAYGGGYAHGGYGWGYVAAPMWVETPTSYTYDKGTILVDIVDAKNEKLVWRGSAQAEVDESRTQQQREQRINGAMKEMLANFPPKVKK
jgi:Domain of unknown function (DUF4136)